MPSDDVAMRLYPPDELPTRTSPYAGAVDTPVPPYAMESVEDAETAPFIACKVPVNAPMVAVLLTTRFEVVAVPK